MADPVNKVAGNVADNAVNKGVDAATSAAPSMLGGLFTMRSLLIVGAGIAIGAFTGGFGWLIGGGVGAVAAIGANFIWPPEGTPNTTEVAQAGSQANGKVASSGPQYAPQQGLPGGGHQRDSSAGRST